MRRVTADSNLYVSALQYGGKPQALLDLAQEGQIQLALSDDILDETLRVLKDKFGRSAEYLRDAEAQLRAITVHVTPTERVGAVHADPSDNKIVECAVASGSDTIISGDRHLLALGSFRGIRIQRVSEFLAEFQSGQR